MAAEYLTSDGDVVDLIVWRVFGETADLAEAMFEANPGLADRGPILPAGLRLTLPAAPAPAITPPLRLWD